MSAAALATNVVYPSSDGQPMAETWIHVQAIMWLHQALQDFFQDREDAFIASDIFWYWKEGDPTKCISPDTMVVLGVQPRALRDRPSFFSWKEGGAVPAVVFEMASENTWKDDLEDKFDKYEALGVREYFLFDPEGVHLVPVLQGYRLRGSAYRRIRSAPELPSELGFRLRAEGKMLRLIDGRTGDPIPTRAERVAAESARADTEKARADAEKARADTLAAEVERLKKLLNPPGTGATP